MAMNSSGLNFIQLPSVITTTLQPALEQEPDYTFRTSGYIFYPIGAIAFLVTAAALILLFLRKRRIDRLRHYLMPLYNFDGTDDDQDWEAELLDDISESCNLRKGYKSMDFPTSRTSAFVS